MFAVTVSIKTRLSRIKVAGFFRSLPAILAGRGSDPHGIRNAFQGAFCQSIFQSIHEAFIAKSRGGSDDLGNVWSPLKPKTIARRLSAKMRDRYPLSNKLWIMQLSQRLLKSLKPGDVMGGRYKPPTDQIAKFTGSGVTLGSKVPYAGRQNALRTLVPRRMKRWVNKATDAGVQAMSNRITALLTSNKL